MCSPSPWKRPSDFRYSLFDLSESVLFSVGFRWDSNRPQEEIPPAIITALRSPPQQASFRILLVEEEHPEYLWIHSSVFDAIGLGLRIWPDFFEAYIARNKLYHDRSRRVPLRARHGTIGHAVFTVARDYLPGRSSCPPVLLIMGKPLFNYYARPSPIRIESVPFTEPASVFLKRSRENAWVATFEHLFKGHMKQYESPPLDMDAVVICTLLPLLEICLDDLKNAYDDANDEYLHTIDPFVAYLPEEERDQSDMEATRFKLRRVVRCYEQCMSEFKRLRTQGIMQPESYEAFRNINEEAKLWVDDARALEVEIRDKLQLQVGSLALEESKKSIQMSNIQIEESKRGKRLTSHSDSLSRLTK